MNKRQALAAIVLGSGFALGALAADYTFPTVNGDLASESDWGRTLPGTSDTVIIGTTGVGYTVGQDVTFGNIKFTAPDTTKITAGEAHVNLKASEKPLDMISQQTEKRYVYLIGGIWDLNNVKWNGMYKNCWLYLQDGAVVTNMANLYVSALAYSGARLFLQNASRIYSTEINVCAKGDTGLLSVESGSSLVSTGTCYMDRDGSGTRAATLRVMGEGSSVTCENVQHGYKGNGNTINILDGGSLTCASIRVTATGNAYKNNVIRMSDGTLDVAEDVAFNSTAAGSGYGLWATNSTIRIGGKFSGNAEDGFYDFQNVKLTVDGSVSFFDAVKGGTTVRFGGSEGTVPVAMKSMDDYFSNVSGGGLNALVIDDGFVMTNTVNQRLCAYMSHSTVRVSGGAKMINEGKAIHLGHEDLTTSISNTLEVLDGGLVQAHDVRLISTGNRIVVSNGTIKASNGIMLGYQYQNKKPTSGARAVLQGATPRLECGEEGTLWVKNDTNLRIEIPAEGYAPGYVPITAKTITFDPDATLDIGYEAFLTAGGGELTLMAFAEDVSAKTYGGLTFVQWLKREETAMNLPKGCKLRLVVDANGSHVVFRAGPPPGMTVIVR